MSTSNETNSRKAPKKKPTHKIRYESPLIEKSSQHEMQDQEQTINSPDALENSPDSLANATDVDALNSFSDENSTEQADSTKSETSLSTLSSSCSSTWQRKNILLTAALAIVIPLTALSAYTSIKDTPTHAFPVASATGTPSATSSPQTATHALRIETYTPEQKIQPLSIRQNNGQRTSRMSLHKPAAASVAFISSGQTDAFDDELKDDASEVTITSGPVLIMVDGKIATAVATVEDYQAVRKALLDPYTKPVAGGKPWRRSFTNDVEVYLAENGFQTVSISEAADILRPLLHVKLREKLFKETSIAFKSEKQEDDTLPAGEILIVTEGKEGIRHESYEIISIDGKEIERNLLGTRVLKKPIHHVEKIGIGLSNLTSSPKKTLSEVHIPEESALSSAAPDAPIPTETFKPASTPAEPSTAPQKASSTNENDSVFIPEESSVPEPKPAETKKAPAPDEGSWPSSAFSAFNFPAPSETWYSNASMGADENYPGINRESETTASGQGVRGPSSPVSFARPVSAGVSSPFGWRPSSGRMHYGTDYGASLGTSIKAAARGTVTWYTKQGDGTFGNVVEINHGGGFTTLYAHCDTISVAEGDRVSAGDVIGTVGSSGATAIHLHFEVRHQGIPYNPAFYFN